MKIDVIYTVPVIVTVDTAEKVVDRVFLDAERIARVQGPVYLSGTAERAKGGTSTRAIQIAENSEWPPWER